MYHLTLTVCANSQTSGNDCITSNQFLVKVDSCDSYITFGVWTPTNPIAYNSTGTNVIVQNSGINYVSTSD